MSNRRSFYNRGIATPSIHQQGSRVAGGSGLDQSSASGDGGNSPGITVSVSGPDGSRVKQYDKTDYVATQLTEAQRMEIMKRVMSGTMTNEEAYEAVVKESKENQTDRLGLEQKKHWIAYMKKNPGGMERVVLSTWVNKINPHGKKQRRGIAITKKALYNLDDHFKVKRRLILNDIEKITDSLNHSGFVLHVPSEYDYWYECKEKKEILATITQHCKAQLMQTQSTSLAACVRTKAQSRRMTLMVGALGRIRSRSVSAPSSRSPRSASTRSRSIGQDESEEGGFIGELERSYKWSMYLAERGFENERVVFADKITKINSRGRRQERLVAITDKAMYNLSDWIEVKRRVALEKIQRVTVSTTSTEFVVHVPSEYDYWFDSPIRTAVIDALRKNGTHIVMVESLLKSLRTLVQKKSHKHVDTLDEKNSLPPCPGLKQICTFTNLTDKRAHTRAELVMTEQSYCESLVRFLNCFAYPLDVERNPKSIMHKRNKWIDIFDNFENIVRFHCDFFCPDLQHCVLQDATTLPVSPQWGTGTISTPASTSPVASLSPNTPSQANPMNFSTQNGPDISRRRRSKSAGAADAKNNINSALGLRAAREGKVTTAPGQKRTTDIGQAFNKRVTLLKTVYEPYLANWTRLQEAVKRLKEKSKYAKFLKKVQDANGGMGISSYLIMPIQRVPRYVLLIKELVKHTDQEHPEYTSLQRALKSIQKIAKVCDSYIK
uniref:DH domain-containing protein n=1 Tax=Lotharella globosa TaxID=91324 RepID=A0A7S4DVG1_9EUKA|mmetsp:Transcript_10424/g.20687  ORF Transcript_10424/g.20687 Transcript_10424/m.20687 type:complete len:720 (+) Transcript_10424:22-2181(+)